MSPSCGDATTPTHAGTMSLTHADVTTSNGDTR
jgi:hypothetical protein